MQTDRQVRQLEDGRWEVWCAKHGEHTKTVFSTEGETMMWWNNHGQSSGDRCSREAPDRRIHREADGRWMVWCEKHGKRHTKTIVETEDEALDWWGEHSGRRKSAWCPHRVDLPAANPFG